MSRKSAPLISVTDLTDTQRNVVCDIGSLGPLLAGWWAELGLSTSTSRSHARRLIEAARAGEWSKVHAIAEHVSLDVSPVIERGDARVWAPAESWAL